MIVRLNRVCFIFFFQAEDGIRDYKVTGVQTCALPIYNFAVELQNKPGSTGYIIGYGTCEGEGLARANRAKDYLVNTRGIDAGRITVIDGGCRAELLVQLFVCEQGATPPAAMTDGTVSHC